MKNKKLNSMRIYNHTFAYATFINILLASCNLRQNEMAVKERLSTYTENNLKEFINVLSSSKEKIKENLKFLADSHSCLPNGLAEFSFSCPDNSMPTDNAKIAKLHYYKDLKVNAVDFHIMNQQNINYFLKGVKIKDSKEHFLSFLQSVYANNSSVENPLKKKIFINDIDCLGFACLYSIFSEAYPHKGDIIYATEQVGELKKIYPRINYIGANRIVNDGKWMQVTQCLNTSYRGMFVVPCDKHEHNIIGLASEYPLCMSPKDWILLIQGEQLDFVLKNMPKKDYLVKYLQLEIHIRELNGQKPTQEILCFSDYVLEEYENIENGQSILSTFGTLASLFDLWIDSNKNLNFMESLYERYILI